MRRAAELMPGHPAANLITSKGEAATQSVFHPSMLCPARRATVCPCPGSAARRPPRRRVDRREPMSTVRLVMAREHIPADPRVFLAGPTPDRSAPVPFWRPKALDLITVRWAGAQPLTVLTPESRCGVRAERYENQVDWETDARAGATAILFWIPRDLRTMPGMTTNVEYGLDVSTGRAVLGVPPDCPNPEHRDTSPRLGRRRRPMQLPLSCGDRCPACDGAGRGSAGADRDYIAGEANDPRSPGWIRTPAQNHPGR
jgi:hypothetical protein